MFSGSEEQNKRIVLYLKSDLENKFGLEKVESVKDILLKGTL